MLSIIIPVFNEATNLPLLYRELTETLARLHQAAEILFVDDASTDETPKVIRQLKGTDPRMRGLRLAANSDKGGALAVGFREARGEICITLDGDLQNDPTDIPLLLAALEQGADLALGWRKKRADSLSKCAASWLFNIFVSVIFRTANSLHHVSRCLHEKNENNTETHTEQKQTKSTETRRCGGLSVGVHRRSAFPVLSVVEGFRPFFAALSKERTRENQNSLSEETIPSVNLRDANTGFKALHRETALSVPLMQGLFRFLPFILAGRGYTVMEIEVHHRPRTSGRSRFRTTTRILSFLKLPRALRSAQEPLKNPEELPAYIELLN
ncbi:MAG: glycosyltransferase [Candidatus Peribacteraceae bacterium]|nr:glycosyltransferase [Candidatus Peribacteraceae bacterium]MDD5742017.1 glycosyltransferase [Candidatus Peribacteraceae bacterium]